jgi:hypothetical protein
LRTPTDAWYGVRPRPSKARTAYRKKKKSIQVRKDLCSTERRGVSPAPAALRLGLGVGPSEAAVERETGRKLAASVRGVGARLRLRM